MGWRLFGSTAVAFLSLVSVSLAQAPQILSVGAEERIGVFGSTRLSIATDSLNQPHVVADSGLGPVLAFFDKVGSWKQTSFNIKSYYVGTAMFFNPRIEIDTVNNVAWVGGPAVTISAPGWCGLAIVVRNNISSTPSVPYVSLNQRICSIDWEPGTIGLDPARPGECIGFSLDGFYARFQYDGLAPDMIARGAGGQMYSGRGGEKNDFRISKAGNYQHRSSGNHGVWNGAVQGYHAQESLYQNSVRSEQGLSPVAFAAYSRYPIMGGDEVYPGVCPDGKDPLSCFIASDFGRQGGVVLNIWNSKLGAMKYPAAANLTIDAAGTSGAPRYAPQMAPATGGGAFICWVRAGRVKIRSMTIDGVFSVESDICAGTVASICTDKEGFLHLVYNAGGGNMAYRKLTVTGAGMSGGVVAVGDCNKDGVADLIWQQGQGSVTNLLLNWTGTSSALIGSPTVFGGKTDWRVQAAGDIDTNGVTDLIWQNSAGQTVVWFMNSDSTKKLETYSFTGATTWRINAAADIDKDGVADFIWQYPTGQVCVWFMNPDGTKRSSFYTYTGTTPWRLAAAGDIDKDGVADLIWQNPSGQTAVWFMNQDGSKKLSVNTYAYATPWQVRGAGDLDGDNVVDMFWQSPITSAVHCWLLNTNGMRKAGYDIAAP